MEGYFYFIFFVVLIIFFLIRYKIKDYIEENKKDPNQYPFKITNIEQTYSKALELLYKDIAPLYLKKIKFKQIKYIKGEIATYLLHYFFISLPDDNKHDIMANLISYVAYKYVPFSFEGYVEFFNLRNKSYFETLSGKKEPACLWSLVDCDNTQQVQKVFFLMCDYIYEDMRVDYFVNELDNKAPLAILNITKASEQAMMFFNIALCTAHACQAVDKYFSQISDEEEINHLSEIKQNENSVDDKQSLISTNETTEHKYKRKKSNVLNLNMVCIIVGLLIYFGIAFFFIRPLQEEYYIDPIDIMIPSCIISVGIIILTLPFLISCLSDLRNFLNSSVKNDCAIITKIFTYIHSFLFYLPRIVLRYTIHTILPCLIACLTIYDFLVGPGIIATIIITVLLFVVISKITAFKDKQILIISVIITLLFVCITKYTIPSYSGNDIFSNNQILASSDTVYIGKTGNKYHKSNCPTLNGNGRKISLEKALGEGRKPCSICGG